MIRILVLGICIGVSLQTSQPGPPGPTDCQDLQATPICLKAIIESFESDSMFWWGTWFDNNCPSPKPYCRKPPQLSAGKNLKSALPGIDETKITKFLNVTFNSKAGSYEGCDTKVTRDEPYTFSLDPTSTERYQSWYARGRPQMSWEATGSEKYTLMVLDIGVGVVHGVWANVAGGVLPGDGVTLSSDIDEAKMYSGPKNSNYEWPNPYVFLLFKQTLDSDITIDASNFTQLFNLQTTLPDHMNKYGLEGPVAVNWLITEGDMYGANFFIQLRILNNCPYYITKALKEGPEHQGRPFLPADHDMSVFIHASLSTPSIDFTICCQDFKVPATDLMFDPIGNPTLGGAITRSGDGVLAFTFNKAGFFAADNFSGERYTLLAVDPDVPFSTAGTPSKPILHMLVTNIKDGIFTTGDVLQPYQGPRPPDNKPHVYYFLLYKQKGAAEFTFNFTDVQKDYVGSETCGRCLFNINDFVTNNGLELVGATWFSVPTDKYVSYAYVQSGRNESTYCSDVPEWTYGQTCGAGSVIVHAAVLTFSFILSKIMF